LGIGDWAQSPIPNPQSPIPNPHDISLILLVKFKIKFLYSFIKMDKNIINFKEFDLFIQKCLDKYFYVEPWKKLYERAGKLHKDIISDKPTIPDLIIYNKTFNKSFCFYSSNPYSYVKFPRMRFILRPKFRKEYNPTDTYGASDEALIYKKDKNLSYKNNFEIKINNSQKEDEKDLQKENLLKNINQNEKMDNPDFKEFQEINSPNKKELELSINQNAEEEEEDEPEWANDDVNDFINEEIEFKAIPKSIEDKLKDDEQFESIPIVPIKEKEKNANDIININVENFFSDENQKELKEISNSNKNKNNILMSKGNFNNLSANKSKEDSFEDILKDQKEKVNNFDNFNNFQNNIIKNKKNSNEYFDIFDTENKFKNIYLEDENSNENIFTSEDEGNNKIQNDFLNQRMNQPKNNSNNRNNIISNRNYPVYNNINNNNLFANNQMLNLGNNQNYISNNMRNNNEKYIYNIYNNNNFNLINLNNLSFHPYSNANTMQNNLFSNFGGFNNPYLQMNKVPYTNISNNYMNNKELYVNNLNNMIKMYNMQKAYNNLNNNIYNNSINNINNNNIQRQNQFLNSQNINNYSLVYNNINNNKNINNINNKFDINNNKEKINDDTKLKNDSKTNKENSNDDLNPIDYSDNPNQILLKNINLKRWIVSEKDKSNFILNFNNRELYEYLKEREGQESFNNLIINDSDTDYFFPTKEIYENLKKLYSYS